MDAFEKFKFDHIAVRKLFLQFKQALQVGDTHQARRLQQAIFHELRVHKASEEEVFYPEAEQVGGGVEDLVVKSKEKQGAIEQLIGQVQELGISDAEFVAKMTELIDVVDQHAAEEEQELLPKLREAVGDKQLDQIIGQLEQAERRHSWPQGPS
jgi:hemerythrin superfamily protein